LSELLEPWVYEWVAARRGSISAEHGLGQLKAEAIGYSRTPQAIAAMAAVKRLFDPAGIMNPYKLLPRAALDMAYAAPPGAGVL
jgi:FAD/FMN-containing dehydrogenase